MFRSREMQNNNTGFTLVEVLVSVALFTVVVTTAVSALIIILDANRKAQNISSTINNAFFTFETMSRLMRTGVNYHCGGGGSTDSPQDCVNGDNEMFFTDDRGQFVHVWLTEVSGIGTIMQEADPNGATTGGISFGPEYPLTSDDFDVETLLFTVTGSDIVSNTEQPKTTITFHGISNPGTSESSELKLQTTVTQRVIDL